MPKQQPLMTYRLDELVAMEHPHNHGYNLSQEGFKSGVLSERALDMLKTCFCLALAMVLASCMMTIIYSREIAVFMVERLN